MTLDDYLSASGLTDTAFAVKVGLAASNVGRLRRGMFRPTLALMQRIARATSGEVMPNDFLPADVGRGEEACVERAEAKTEDGR